MEKKDIYSIRKSKVGAVSAKIAAVAFLALAGGAVAENVANHAVYAADEQVEKKEETIIKSPVDYIADPTKDVGVREEKTTGQDGKLIFTTKDKETTVDRIEPTKTEVVLGTKPKVESKIEKAKTEYVEDNTLEGGTKQVVTEAKDGEDTTTTTYKIVVKPKVELDKKVEEALTSDKYMYTDEKIYSIDNTKSLPSDKIVIDKLFVKVPTTQNIGDQTSGRELVYSDLTLVEPTTGNYSGKKLTTEMLDPTDPEIRKLKYEITEDGFNDRKVELNLTDDNDFYYLLLNKASNYLIDFVRGLNVEKLIPTYLGAPTYRSDLTEEKGIQRYFAKDILTESMYADAKANYERLKLAKSRLSNLNKYQENLIKWGEVAFDSITQHYNYLNGVDNLNIKYEGNIPENIKKEFEIEYKKIPYEYRRNIINLLITDKDIGTTNELEATGGDWAAGIASAPTRDIKLRYYENVGTNKINQPITMVMVLLHELGHTVDAKSGTMHFVVPQIKSQYDPLAMHRRMAGQSGTTEFSEVYNKYFFNARPYDRYVTHYSQEAFAEHLGRYVFKRTYNKQYPRYIEENGKAVRVYPEDPRYATAFSPMDIPEVEYYFASLYNKLFEQPTEASVVVDTITTKKQNLQNGLVKVGTKPKEETIVIPFTSTTREDATLASGLTRVLQAGVNGETLRRTTYTLNKATGDVSESTSENIIKKMVEEIILVGTKVEDEPNEKPVVRTDEKTTIVVIPYRTTLQQDPTLRRGERIVKVRGQNGRKEVKTTQFIVNDQVLDTKIDEKIIVDPIDEIILVGTLDLKPGQTFKRVEVRSGRLPYRTITRNNPTLEAGQIRTVQRGVEGSFKVVRDDIYEGEKLIEKGKEYEIERIEAIDEIIEIGTKKTKRDEIKPPKKDEEKPKPPKKDERRNNPLINGEKHPRSEEKPTQRTNSENRHLPNTDADVTNAATVGLVGLVAATILARRKKEEK